MFALFAKLEVAGSPPQLRLLRWDFGAPMAAAAIGGLLFNAFVALFLVPNLYTWLARGDRGARFRAQRVRSSPRRTHEPAI